MKGVNVKITILGDYSFHSLTVASATDSYFSSQYVDDTVSLDEGHHRLKPKLQTGSVPTM